MESLHLVRPFSVVKVPRYGVTAAAYPKLIGRPVIFDRKPGIHRLALRFLLDLTYAKWRFPEGFHNKLGARKPARKSMINTAERLANFLDWADRRALDLHSCDYEQSIERYRTEMSSGVWSRSGGKLADSTVEMRVEVAVQYLRWMADVGEREPFEVKTKIVIVSYGSHDSSRKSTKKVEVREDKRKPKPRRNITLPTKPQVVEWLKKARELHGPAFELIANSILRTGIRREEAVCLRLDSLPQNPSDWEVVNTIQPLHLQEVAVKLEWGCKGRTLETCSITGDERKDGRDIRVPRTLALKWHEYRRKNRVKAMAKSLAGLKGKHREEVAASLLHLFLRDGDGQRWTGKAVWDAWTSVPREFPGAWHPHMGRHFWACMTLWDATQRLDAEERGNEKNVLSIIKTRIQPQLGHLSEETTMLYLRWAMNQLGTPLVLDETDEETGADPKDLDEYED